MVIAYIGNFHQPWTTETYIFNTLTDMGHQVIKIQEDEIAGRIPGYNVDLLLWTRKWPGRVRRADLEWYKSRGIPTVSYHLDYYVGLPRESNLDTDLFWRTDHVFQIDGDPAHMEVFKRKGINVHYLPAGVYKKDCIKAQPIEGVPEIIFVGGAENYPATVWPYRMELINFLRGTYGSKFKRYPTNGVRVWGSDLNALYASAKIVIGDSICLGFNQERAWSDRIYETTGRGGFIIHPYIKGLEDNFTKGELVTYRYGDFEELKGLIGFYLDPANAIIREKLQDSGRARTKRDHTYNNRMQEILDVVFQN